MRTLFYLLLSLLVLACSTAPGGKPCPFPTPPTGHGPLTLVAAGAPVELFGEVTAPRYAAVFADLAAAGFDQFFPLFQVCEPLTPDQQCFTAHWLHFLPTGCAGPSNPYAAARGVIQILFPVFAIVPGQNPGVEALPRAETAAAYQAFVQTCLAGDESVLGGLYSFDEPGAQAVATRLDADPANDLDPANVPALSEALRSVTSLPVVVVEGALPFFFENYPYDPPLTPELRQTLEDQFWLFAGQAAAGADIYGFDLYPVEKPAGAPKLAAIGDYVDHARRLAPGKEIAMVLQGFGEEDFGGLSGRRPTTTETRFMAYHALVRGARTLVWYGQSALEPEAALWADIRKVAAELRALSPVLDLPAIALDLPADIAPVEIRAFGDDRATFLVLVNASSTERTVTLPLDPPGTMFELWSGASLGSGAQLTRVLPAYGVAVLAISRCQD